MSGRVRRVTGVVRGRQEAHRERGEVDVDILEPES